MSVRNAKLELKCPFTHGSVEDAFGQEVSLFIHCHLRGYDQNGFGKQMDATYYDKYGAPVKKNQSWTEGYHAIEMKLADHFNICEKLKMFPLVAGMGGGAHLYKNFHQEKPWNWTGWIPMQNKWLCEGQFFSNRYFLSIRGNEIQNNLWDYHPQHERKDEDNDDDMEYSQIEPTDKYRGGYFFKGNPFGRYLHIISLKSHEQPAKRYNYIVHPLAYRISLNKLPDNSVDAMQWDIINIVKEEHFGQGKDWGEKVHGLEIFNDFTYYHSYLPTDEDCSTYNGVLANPVREGDVAKDNNYINWFNTYAFEYAEFLLESSLTRGAYMQTLCANDAFYQRITTHGNSSVNEEQVLLADPKGYIVHNLLKTVKDITPHFTKTKAERMLEQEHERDTDKDILREIKEFLSGRPFRFNTVFGYTTLIDTKEKLKETVFNRENESSVAGAGLDDGGLLAMDYLREGRFYCSTGVYDLFNYETDSQIIPYEIKGQQNPERLCYEITAPMKLIFTFAKCKERNADLVWRYSIAKEVHQNFETVYGYFKLSESKKTVLDLSQSYEREKVKWLYFMAIDQNNPMRRAWFSAIRGPAFGKPQCDENEFSKLHTVMQQKVYSTIESEGTVTQGREVEPFSVTSSELDFQFPKADEDYIYAYFMQAKPLQQDLHLEETKESDKERPPRYLQNVHGYFALNEEYGTRIKMSNSWDKETVEKVYFYQIDKNGQPEDISSKLKPARFS